MMTEGRPWKSWATLDEDLAGPGKQVGINLDPIND